MIFKITQPIIEPTEGSPHLAKLAHINSTAIAFCRFYHAFSVSFSRTFLFKARYSYCF